MIVAFTGHRPDKLGNDYSMTGPISAYIAEEIDKILEEYQPEAGIYGAALGVDTIAAICCLYKKIPLTAAIPFKGQESMWPQGSQDMYNRLINHRLVTKRYISEPGYSAYKMQVRNEFMINKLDGPNDLLVGVWDGSSGGTANCIRYAQKKGKNILVINPKNAMA